MVFLALIAWALKHKLDASITSLQSQLKEQIRIDKKLNKQPRKQKERISWNEFTETITNSHRFRRMFRMNRGTFDLLCIQIANKIGHKTFRSESFMSEGGMRDQQTFAAQQHSGGYTSGEIKLAVTIRLLAGGSYLDLIPLFDIVKSSIYSVFDQVIGWVIKTLSFPLVETLRDENWTVMHAMAQEFAEKSEGFFYGAFGSLDGLAVRISSPRLRDVPDPGNYHCRKGFYALNVQAICDKHKRFLWVAPMNKGSSHDSSAFGNTKLIELLKEKAQQLLEQGLFLNGDSAYPMYLFLQVPYNQQEVKADPVGAKDAYNCYHSANHIWIECAFGELIMRWGCFWRTLRFNSLEKNGRVIYAAMLLHNFIVDSRLNSTDDDQCFRDFSANITSSSQSRMTQLTGESPRALVSDNNEPRPLGRPSMSEKAMIAQGELLRNNLMLSLSARGDFRRPTERGMKYNSEGLIYMEC